jgi:hypothetical protein
MMVTAMTMKKRRKRLLQRETKRKSRVKGRERKPSR